MTARPPATVRSRLPTVKSAAGRKSLILKAETRVWPTACSCLVAARYRVDASLWTAIAPHRMIVAADSRACRTKRDALFATSRPGEPASTRADRAPRAPIVVSALFALRSRVKRRAFVATRTPRARVDQAWAAEAAPVDRPRRSAPNMVKIVKPTTTAAPTCPAMSVPRPAVTPSCVDGSRARSARRSAARGSVISRRKIERVRKRPNDAAPRL